MLAEWLSTTGAAGLDILQAASKRLTNLVEEQNDLLVSARFAHQALHIQAAAPERVPCIQNLNDYISCLHNLDKLFVEGPPAAVCMTRHPGSTKLTRFPSD